MGKNKKVFILGLMMLLGVTVFSRAPAFAGISISLVGENWDIGTIKASGEISSSQTLIPGDPGVWTITNNSGGVETIQIKAVSSGNWIANQTQYGELTSNEFRLAVVNVCPQNSCNFLTPLYEENQYLQNGCEGKMGDNESVIFSLKFNSPPVGSEEGEHTITVTLTASNWHTWVCGDNFVVNHTIANGVAPVDSTVVYGTVETNLSGESKCWITKNLGADRRGGYTTDDSNVSAGWYWQFNRKQGYKHDGTTRTPDAAWPTAISEDSNWLAENDPCTIELGAGWRLPTQTEWAAVLSNGGWANSNDFYASVLRLHLSGALSDLDGSLAYARGSVGGYYSSTQESVPTAGRMLANNIFSVIAGTTNCGKSYALPVRCIKD